MLLRLLSRLQCCPKSKATSSATPSMSLCGTDKGVDSASCVMLVSFVILEKCCAIDFVPLVQLVLLSPEIVVVISLHIFGKTFRRNHLSLRCVPMHQDAPYRFVGIPIVLNGFLECPRAIYCCCTAIQSQKELPYCAQPSKG